MTRKGTAVYVADTEALWDDGVFQAAYGMVSEERRKKVDRFIFRRDKMLSLAAGLLLKKGLSDRGIIEYSIAYGVGGKPCLSDWTYGITGKVWKDPVYFNLSHSEERVMCVISDAEAGCDVEKVTDIELEIARRFFFTTEYETIAAGSTQERQRELFYRLWTLKESFMKATGLGMALPLDSFRIELIRGLAEKDDVQTASLFHRVNEKEYHLKEYEMKDGYRYAVCTLSGGAAFPSVMEAVDLSQMK